jgi:hypothetical protein
LPAKRFLHDLRYANRDRWAAGLNMAVSGSRTRSQTGDSGNEESRNRQRNRSPTLERSREKHSAVVNHRVLDQPSLLFSELRLRLAPLHNSFDDFAQLFHGKIAGPAEFNYPLLRLSDFGSDRWNCRGNLRRYRENSVTITVQ